MRPLALARRVLLWAFAAVSLAIFFSAAFCWYRSQDTFDEYIYARAGGHFVWIVSSNGRLTICTVSGWKQNRRLEHRSSMYGFHFVEGVAYPSTVTLLRGGRELWVFKGPAYAEQRGVPASPTASGWGFGTTWRLLTGSLALVAAIPNGLLFVLFLLALLRRRRLARQGYCARCGYDLRASTERCPECAAPIPAGMIRRPIR